MNTRPALRFPLELMTAEDDRVARRLERARLELLERAQLERPPGADTESDDCPACGHPWTAHGPVGCTVRDHAGAPYVGSQGWTDCPCRNATGGGF